MRQVHVSLARTKAEQAFLARPSDGRQNPEWQLSIEFPAF